METDFYAVPSAGRVTPQVSIGTLLWLFLSTPSARRATQPLDHLIRERTISIHALREEGDLHPQGHLKSLRVFLSTPSARRATPHSFVLVARRVFLSTPSARRATPQGPLYVRQHWDFYPRPPRGGRRLVVNDLITCHVISIHALREEGDQGFRLISRLHVISIHALREEGDQNQAV